MIAWSDATLFPVWVFKIYRSGEADSAQWKVKLKVESEGTRSLSPALFTLQMGADGAVL
jgi:hypothetical protein